MNHLTEGTPKPMLKIGDKNLLEYKIERLPDSVTEIIFVIGYKGDQIRAHFGDSFLGRKIQYVVQEKLEGTGRALWEAKNLLQKKFMVMNGDDIYAKEDLEKCLLYDWALLAKRRKSKNEQGARIVLNAEGKLKNIIEDSNQTTEDRKLNLINAGVYVLSRPFFEYKLVKLPGRSEWGLPQTVALLAKKFPVQIVETDFWIPVTSPADLIITESILVSRK